MMYDGSRVHILIRYLRDAITYLHARLREGTHKAR